MIRAVQARDARKRFREMAPVLNEQSLRRFVAMEARALGRGGVSLMSRISGLARSTIYHGLTDIRDHVSAPTGRIRKPGGGRKKKSSEDPTLVSRRSSLTPVGETLWPLAASAFTRLRVVHNRSCIGSPRVVGSTNLLRSTTRVGSSDDFFFRPPPGLRIRPVGAETWSRMSVSP